MWVPKSHNVNTFATGWIAIEFFGMKFMCEKNFRDSLARKWTQTPMGSWKLRGRKIGKIPKLCKMQTVKKLTKMSFLNSSCSVLFWADVTKVSFWKALGGLSYEIKYSIPILIYEWDGKNENNHAQCASRDFARNCEWLELLLHMAIKNKVNGLRFCLHSKNWEKFNIFASPLSMRNWLSTHVCLRKNWSLDHLLIVLKPFCIFIPRVNRFKRQSIFSDFFRESSINFNRLKAKLCVHSV